MGRAKKEIDGLMKEDMFVVWGGANNIANSESVTGLTHISNFVNREGIRIIFNSECSH